MLGNFDSFSVSMGTFTLTQTSDGSGACDELTIDSNGQSAFAEDDEGPPPDSGTTLDSTNGFSSVLWTGDWGASDAGASGQARDASSQIMLPNPAGCSDGGGPSGQALTSGFVFGE